MAIRHGHGKIVTDGLVFAYDTGDTRNSYKGRPTTNIAPYISTHGTSDFAPPSLPEGVFTVHSKGAIINGTTNWADIFNTSGYSIPNGERLVISAWVYIPADKVNNRFNINADINGSNTGLASWHDLEAGRWHKLRGSWLNSTGTTANVTYTRLEPWTPAEWTGGTNTAYAINFMVESGPFSASYMGSQALPANTTRSATQGLLNLTGNSTIDLSNVSFDSNAQMTFDGTSDYIQTSYDYTTENITIEQVLKSPMTTRTCPFGMLDTLSGTSYHCLDWWIDPSGTMRVYTYDGSGYCDQGTNSYNIPANHANEYFHLVVSKQGDLLQIYVNGNQVHSSSTWSNGGPPIAISVPYARIGTRSYNGNASQSWIGEIPFSKIYNRALTAEEVKNNFNHYKGRFDL